MQPSVHRAVLLEESMLVLDVQPAGRYLDGTLGGGTHTRELLLRSSPDGEVLSLDVDVVALTRAQTTLRAFGSRWHGVESNFRHMVAAARSMDWEEGSVDGILLDLGLSSDELEDPERGISFRFDGPLDMRLGPASNDDGLTATEIINTWSEADIAQLIHVFGEERFARRIARAVVAQRKLAPIVRTQELVDVVLSAIPGGYEHGRIHGATRTFQALRIAVNDELQALKAAIAEAHRLLRVGGRLAIISFHSLEDGIVKRAFQEPSWNAITKRPIVPSIEEVSANIRSRSAKLRAATKVA